MPALGQSIHVNAVPPASSLRSTNISTPTHPVGPVRAMGRRSLRPLLTGKTALRYAKPMPLEHSSRSHPAKEQVEGGRTACAVHALLMADRIQVLSLSWNHSGLPMVAPLDRPQFGAYGQKRTSTCRKSPIKPSKMSRRRLFRR